MNISCKLTYIFVFKTILVCQSCVDANAITPSLPRGYHVYDLFDTLTCSGSSLCCDCMCLAMAAMRISKGHQKGWQLFGQRVFGANSTFVSVLSYVLNKVVVSSEAKMGVSGSVIASIVAGRRVSNQHLREKSKAH